MSQNPMPGGSGDMDEEALKRLLKETFGDALPEGALDGLDLGAIAAQANLPQDPAQLRAAAAQMQQMFMGSGEGPVNWTMAEDLARRAAVGSLQIPGAPGAPAPTGSPGDPDPSPAQVQELREAARGTDNLLPFIHDALRDRCSLGEVCGAMRDVFGEYQPDV